jgi:hypothetical protein
MPYVNAAVLTKLFILLRLGVLDEVGIPDCSLNFKRELCWLFVIIVGYHIMHCVNRKFD